MFHIQLRQFPHKACHFNMTEQELLAVARPWVLEQWIEVGERKWNPHQAELTIVEGPHLELEELSMGRGWQNAQHGGQDVTERMLTQARASLREPAVKPEPAPQAPLAMTPGVSPPLGSSSASAAGDTPAAPAELLHLLGEEPQELLQAWRLAAGRRPDLSPSQCLALAEETLRSLDGDGR